MRMKQRAGLNGHHMKRTKVDIALVIALKEEFRELQQGAGLVLADHESRDGRTYHYFTFADGTSAQRTGVALFLDDVGIAPAQTATHHIIKHLQPGLVINLGISGMLSGDLRIGDVVVPQHVQNFSAHMKASLDYSGDASTLDALQLGGYGFPTDRELADALTNVEFSMKAEFRGWQEDGRKRLAARLSKKQWRELQKQRLLRDLPQLLSGSAAAGDFVVKSGAFKERVKSSNTKFVACDMESAGVMAAIYDCPHNDRPRALVIRAISDPADERKKELENIEEGLLRRWAMTNAYRVLRMVFGCTTFDSSEEGPATERESTTTPPDADVAEEIHAQVMRHHLAKRFPANFATSADDFGRHVRLFRTLVLLDGQPQLEQDAFALVEAKVRASTSATPLQVDGPPGSGKSLFLALLYLRMHAEHLRNPAAPIPVFVDLARYDESVYRVPPNEFEGAVRALVEQDLQPVARGIARRPDAAFVVIIDSFTQYRNFQKIAAGTILQFCEAHSCIRKVIAVRLDGANRMDTPWGPDNVVALRAIPCSDTTLLESFLEDFVASKIEPAIKLEHLRERIVAFRLTEVDLYTTALLASKHQSAAYRTFTSLSQFYRQYCVEYLGSPGGSHELNDVAGLAFKATIQKIPIPHEALKKSLVAWSLIHVHSNIRDFLVALHLVNEVGQYAQKLTRKSSRRALSYVFPSQITRFTKEVNMSHEQQETVLNAARLAAENYDSIRLRTVLSYLIGRFEGALSATRAREWLRSQRARIEEGLDPTNKAVMLLARTTYISLVYLGDREASVAYTSKLLSDPNWDAINRGFHLEYYGDLPYDPASEDQLASEDVLGPFPRTFTQLALRLQQHLSPNGYHLFDIELQTICSLALHRHAAGLLDERQRVELLGILDRVIASKRIADSTMTQYVGMAREHLGLSRFRLGVYAERLNTIKTNKRMGWVRRGLTDVESIADHTLGAYLLGLFYLRDSCVERGYDKQHILNLILAHDLAESFTGDIPARERTDGSVADERMWFTRMALLSNYRDMPDLSVVRDRWEEFELGMTANAKIAKDLDKLELFTQLHVYNKQFTIKDYEEFQHGLRQDVQSAEGRRILALLDDHFRAEVEAS